MQCYIAYKLILIQLWILFHESVADIKIECQQMCTCLFPPTDRYKIMSISSFEDRLLVVFGPIINPSADQIYQIQLSPSLPSSALTPLYKVKLSNTFLNQLSPNVNSLSTLYPALASHLRGQFIYVLYQLSKELIWITLRSEMKIGSNKTLLLYDIRNNKVYTPAIKKPQNFRRIIQYFSDFIPIAHSKFDKDENENSAEIYRVHLFLPDMNIWLECKLKILPNYDLEPKREYIRYFGFESINLDMILVNRGREGFKSLMLLKSLNKINKQTKFIPVEWLILSKPYLSFSFRDLVYFLTDNGTLFYFPKFNFRENLKYYIGQLKTEKITVESLFDCPANRNVTTEGKTLAVFKVLSEKDLFPFENHQKAVINNNPINNNTNWGLIVFYCIGLLVIVALIVTIVVLWHQCYFNKSKKVLSRKNKSKVNTAITASTTTTTNDITSTTTNKCLTREFKNKKSITGSKIKLSKSKQKLKSTKNSMSKKAKHNFFNKIKKLGFFS